MIRDVIALTLLSLLQCQHVVTRIKASLIESLKRYRYEIHPGWMTNSAGDSKVRLSSKDLMLEALPATPHVDLLLAMPRPKVD